jgi:RNA polymerase sigma factor for flagellar operon FliA
VGRAKTKISLSAELRSWCELETVRLLPLVARIARNCNVPLPLEDLMQEGAIACFEALPRFDAGRGLKLETFVGLRIRGAILDYVRQHGRLLSGGMRTGRREVVVSLQRPLTDSSFADNEPLTVGETLADPNAVDPALASHRDRWRQMLKGLSTTERIILLSYFVAGETREQIAQSIGLSESRVSQIMSQGLGQLRAADAIDGRVREACA